MIAKEKRFVSIHDGPELSRETKRSCLLENERLVHELRTRQGELELQNQELRRSQRELEASHSKYSNLYDLAPVGYFSLDKNGLILEANLTGADLLGEHREALIHRQFPLFVADRRDLNIFSAHLRDVFERRGLQTCEIKLKRKYGPVLYVRVQSIAVEDIEENTAYSQTAIIDITGRKAIEEALSNSRRQSRELYLNLLDIREEERTSIARELHDELGQTLTALKMDASWFSTRVAGKGKLSERAESMSELVDTMIQSLKRILSDLRPSVLDHLGLSAAIDWQVKEFRRKTGIDCELDMNPSDIVLDKERSTALFRIFQEALTNVIRHAEATKVRVSLAKADKETILEIEDNGKGITREQIADPQSFGLVGIRERAHSLGGAAKVTASRTGGTTVAVSIPTASS